MREFQIPEEATEKELMKETEEALMRERVKASPLSMFIKTPTLETSPTLGLASVT